MASENNTNVTDEGDSDYSAYLMYSGLGFAEFVPNILIFLAICRQRELRMAKEYVVIAGLALADWLDGVGFISAGIYRTTLVVTGRHTNLVTSWDCMLKMHSVVWSVGDTAAAWMLVCVSVDRLFSITFPMRYYTLSERYAYKLVGGFYAGICAFALSMFFVSYATPREAIYPEICFTSFAFYAGSFYKKLYLQVRYIGPLLSVGIYVLVLLIFLRKRKDTVGPSGAGMAHQAKAQRRMLVTLGLSTFITFAFYCCPMIAVNILESLPDSSNSWLWARVISWGSIIMRFNPIANFFIYTIRHKIMRLAVASLFTCKELPPGITD